MSTIVMIFPLLELMVFGAEYPIIIDIRLPLNFNWSKKNFNVCYIQTPMRLETRLVFRKTISTSAEKSEWKKKCRLLPSDSDSNRFEFDVMFTKRILCSVLLVSEPKSRAACQMWTFGIYNYAHNTYCSTIAPTQYDLYD